MCTVYISSCRWSSTTTFGDTIPHTVLHNSKIPCQLTYAHTSAPKTYTRENSSCAIIEAFPCIQNNSVFGVYFPTALKANNQSLANMWLLPHPPMMWTTVLCFLLMFCIYVLLPLWEKPHVQFVYTLNPLVACHPYSLLCSRGLFAPTSHPLW